MKRDNRRSHTEIFSQLFGVDMPTPGFWGHPRMTAWAEAQKSNSALWIGINPYAGGRWPSKELRPGELEILITELLSPGGPLPSNGRLVLLGGGRDRERNLALAKVMDDSRIWVPDTDDSVLRLAAVIGHLDYLVTSDSLALHLGIAQHIPFLAFFAPTSAAEIDTFGFGTKVASTASDYCSYRKDADNRSVTAARILTSMKAHRPAMFAATASV